ncbi:MAG: hypothetical protein GY731_07840, partial [Gammaproteobacteria bacterium]|nr:hypothetical protein [Gammaproteobacteria bacterium]
MSYSLPIRLLLAAVVSLVLALTLLAILYATDVGFSVWEHLRQTSLWFIGTYAALIFIIAAGGAWLIWRLIYPRKRKDKKQNTSVPPPPITEEEVEKKLSQAEKAGINVESALQE